MSRARDPYSTYRIRSLLIAVILPIIIAVLWVAGPVFQKLELMAVDMRFEARGNVEHRVENILHVDIDDSSLAEIGIWPWPRDLHALAVDTLTYLEARAIVFDVEFIERQNPRLVSEDYNSDEMLGRAIRQSRRSYLIVGPDPRFDSKTQLYEYIPERSAVPEPTAFKAPSYPAVFQPFETFAEGAKGFGTIDILEADPDGVLRRMPIVMKMAGHCFLQLGVRVALDEMGATGIRWDGFDLVGDLPDGKSVRIPTDPDGKLFINWTTTGRDSFLKAFNHIPYRALKTMGEAVNKKQKLEEALEEISEPEKRKAIEEQIASIDGLLAEGRKRVKDKVCFIGSSARGAMDMKATPTNPVMPGVAAHSNIFNTVLTRQFLVECPTWASISIILASGVIVVAFARASRTWLIVGPTVAVTAYAVAGMLAFNNGWILPMAGPIFALAVPTGVIFWYRYFTEETTKRRIRETFDQYADPEIVDQLLYDPDIVQGIAHRVSATVMFTDIEGFSKFSEETPPDEVVKILNVYLTDLTATIKYYQGYVNKYLGDGTMSIFGIRKGETPAGAAEHACRAALEIQAKLKEKKLPFGRTRIGIASGVIIVGPIGGVQKEGKKEYTAIGDVVNVSSRLQGMNKDLKTSILFETETFKLIEGKLPAKCLGSQVVRGRAESVTVYTIE